MPHININNANLYYEEHGSGAQTILFGHGLLWSGAMFAAQIAAFKDRYRCVTVDWRGQGQSEVTKEGYDMDSLYEDAAALIERLGLAPCHFAGLSMGGFIGMRLAARRPELLRSLILMETSAEPEPSENVPQYRRLAFVSRWFGPRMVADKVMPIMFGQKFLNDPARATQKAEWRARLAGNHKVGMARAALGVIERQGVTEELARITLPTLVMVGDQDVATVPAKAERIHAGIANSQLVIIPGAGHTATVEEPATVNAALAAFLARMA